MKTKLTVLSMLCGIIMYSQTPGKIEYAPVGAKWVYDVYYRSTSINPIAKQGFIEYLVEKDTLVHNRNCKKIIVNSFCNPAELGYLDLVPYNCGNGQSGIGFKYTLTFISQDTVYFFTHLNKTFKPVFYLTANTESLQVCFWGYQSHYQSVPWVYNPCNSITPTVNMQGYAASINDIFLFNDTLKKYNIILNYPIYPPYNETPLSYIEKIGFLFSKGGMIPFSTYSNMEQSYEIGNLKCYYDPIFGWTQFDFNNQCYYYGPVNIMENNIEKYVRYQINDGLIHIFSNQHNKPYAVYLYDVCGKLCKTSDVVNHDVYLNCNDLKSGMYVLVIKMDNHHYRAKILL